MGISQPGNGSDELEVVIQDGLGRIEDTLRIAKEGMPDDPEGAYRKAFEDLLARIRSGDASEEEYQRWIQALQTSNESLATVGESFLKIVDIVGELRGKDATASKTSLMEESKAYERSNLEDLARLEAAWAERNQ